MNCTARRIAKRSPRFARALLLTEVAVCVAILAVLAALFAKVCFDYSRARSDYSWRQAASWAAHAQMQRYRCGAAIDSQPPQGVLAAEISLQTTVSPGQGQWQGFSRVMVTATARMAYGRGLSEQAAGYFAPAEVIR